MAHYGGMSSRIFINYRREDSPGSAGRLYDRLTEEFPTDHLFMDVDAIAPGLDFVSEIDVAVRSCDVLLAIIGRNWLDAKDAEGHRRLDNPEDFVRIEIATALKNKVLVIPVLVDGASMPDLSELPDDLKALSHRQAIELRHNRFAADTQILLKALERGTALPERHVGTRKEPTTATAETSALGSAAKADICRLGHRLCDHFFRGDRRCLRCRRGDRLLARARRTRRDALGQLQRHGRSRIVSQALGAGPHVAAIHGCCRRYFRRAPDHGHHANDLADALLPRRRARPSEHEHEREYSGHWPDRATDLAVDRVRARLLLGSGAARVVSRWWRRGLCAPNVPDLDGHGRADGVHNVSLHHVQFSVCSGAPRRPRGLRAR
jgi:hypothetical protein